MVKNDIKKYLWMIGVSVVTFVVFLSSIFLIFVPLSKSISTANKTLKVKREDLAVVTHRLELLQSMKERESELEKERDIVWTAVPTNKAVGDLFLQIDKAVENSGGTVGSILESTSVSASQIAEINTTYYTVAATFPDYNGFKSFLERCENSIRFITLDKFSVGKVEENRFTVTLTYISYYRSIE